MDLKLPHLGEGADSGTVVNLFVKEGDRLAEGQAVLELENEKAVATIPASTGGVVEKVYVKVGDKVSVGQRLLSLSEGETPAAAAGGQESKAESQKPERKTEDTSRESKAEAQAPEEEGSAQEAQTGAPPAAAPSVRKLARMLGIDLARVRGSARGGRITMEDLRAYIGRLQKQAVKPSEGGAPAAKPAVERIDFSKWGKVTSKKLSPLREVIARRMADSWVSVPRVTQFDEADVSGLLGLREKYAEIYKLKGARLTLTSFVLKAVAEMLKKHPVFNSSLDEAAEEIVFKEYVHLGIAVDTEAGLMVPVLRDADKKDIFQISKELEDLAMRARERKIAAEEMKGGSFTISNQGGIGGGHFTPIVNKPDVAILGLGKGALKPVVRGNKIEPRTMLPLALSYDHRVIDGGAAARFIVDLVKAIEGFEESLVKLK